MTAPMDVRKAMEARVTDLRNVRENWKPLWTELRDYELPDHGFPLDDEEQYNGDDGTKKYSKIIDDTATDAVDILAAGLQSGVTSPSRPWFRLVPDDPGLLAYGPARQWLTDVETILYHIIARSNTYNAFHHVYTEIPVFGTAAMAVLESFDTVIRCRPFTCGEYAIATDSEQKVNTFYREVRMTAAQMKEQFGEEKLSQAVRDKLATNPDATFSVCQLIEPNDTRFKVRDAQGRKYRSIYWEKKGDTSLLLKVSGFEEFPIMSPRWLVVANQIYGRSPGMKVLGDVKMLQKLQEQSLIALAKQVEPPVQAPGSLKNENINTMPAGVSYFDESTGGNGIRPLYEMRVDLNAVEAKIDQTARRIKEGYFNDLFKMLSTLPDKERTAREIAERHEEKLLMLGPVLERLHGELLDPFINRVFAIASRNNLLPPAPPELQGRDFRPEYISMLATAQRMVSTYGIEETSAFVGALVAIKPDVPDVLDLDAMVRSMADLKGVNPKLVRDQDAVDSIRQERAKQQQAMQAAEMAKQLAPAAKTIAELPLGQNNSLATALGGPLQ